MARAVRCVDVTGRAGYRVAGMAGQQDARLPSSFVDDAGARDAVDLAMSQQLGSSTVHVPKSRVTPFGVPTDQAMRAVLTDQFVVCSLSLCAP